MIYICLTLTAIIIMVVAQLIRKYSKIYKRAISFRESFDLSGLPVITFNQGKRKFNFLFDTGATNSVINSTVLDKVKYTKLEGYQCEVYGMEGNVQNVEMVTIDFKRDIEFSDDFQVVDMSAAFDSVKAETGVTISGILGNTFFQKYKYVIDYEQMIVYPKA